MSAVPIRGSVTSTAARCPSGEIRTEPNSPSANSNRTRCRAIVPGERERIAAALISEDAVAGSTEGAIAKRSIVPDLVGNLHRLTGQSERHRIELLRQQRAILNEQQATGRGEHGARHPFASAGVTSEESSDAAYT